MIDVTGGNIKPKGFFERYVKVIVILAVIAGSASGIFGSVIEAPSMAIGFWRLTFGLPVFAVPFFRRGKGIKELRTVSRQSLVYTTFAGAFLFLHFFSWFSAVKLTNIASASVLAALHPLVVLFITVFVFKRHVGRRPVMGILCALAGATMIAGFDYKELASGSFKGDVLSLGAAIFMGLYFAMGHEARKSISGNTYVFLCFLCCWICFAAGMLVTGTSFTSYPTEDWIYILGLTLVCQIGAHAVFNLCMGHVSSLYVSAWESGEAVSATILAFIFLGQVPEEWQLIGMVIVVIGLVYYNYYSSLESNKTEEIEDIENELQS
ncbi:MAG: DMT family transporter [Clostridiales bacterium]|nr:DMT family transporter [Clostridiales bacterium]MDY4059980.1 DMT family transporter [Anaerovoracaceae bacterium]